MKINSIKYIDTAGISDWKYHMHMHERENEISLILSGRGKLYSNSHIYDYAEGDIVIKNAGISHGESADNDAPVKMLWILIENEHRLLPADIRPVISKAVSFPLLKEISLYCMEHPEMNTVFSEPFCTVLNSVLSMHHEPDHLKKSERIILEIIEDIDMNFQRKMSLKALAEKHYISPYYMARKFKEITDVTVNEYITNRRIGEAQHLLQETDKPIRDIAEECGFETVQYFHTVFHKVTGSTPRAFRKKK